MGYHCDVGPEARAQRKEFVDFPMRREHARAEAVRVTRNHVERARTDRAGGAEYRNAFHSPSNALTNAKNGNAANTPSRRSHTPPCPGNSAPESFTPA